VIQTREEIKKYESIAAERAAASGEERVPVETAADRRRICWALDEKRDFLWSEQFYTCGCEFRGCSMSKLETRSQRFDRVMDVRCAICLRLLTDDRGNDWHYEHTGNCSTCKAPPQSGYYLKAKPGFHAVLLASAWAEASRMGRNDKVVDMSGPWAAERRQADMQRESLAMLSEDPLLLEKQAGMQRESLAMLSEDLVLFRKLFLCVQLDPVAGNRTKMPWNETNEWPRGWAPFDDLAAALTWLRAPSVTDPQIAKIYGGRQSFREWQIFNPILSRLPGNALLMRELHLRQTKCPKWMELWIEGHPHKERWWYMDAERIRYLTKMSKTG